MVLIIAFSVAAAAYAAGGDGGGGGGGDENGDVEPPIDLTGKTGVDLLPLERTLTLFEAPITTVTFMEGDPTAASEFLRRRVADVAYRNPWLGGWLAKDGDRGDAIRLFYDESSDDLAPGLFRSYEPGEVSLARDTPYVEYGPAFDGRDVVVKNNASLVGRNEAVWRVSVIPDARDPKDRFALVVSMSHVIGDGYTYFKVFNMLRTDGEIEALNPRRKHKFSEEVLETMGREEAYYIDRVARSPVWAQFMMKDDTILERKVFYVDEVWVEGQKRAWAKVASIDAASAMYEDEGDDGKDDDAKEEQGKGGEPDGGSSSNFAVSFAAHHSAPSLTSNDVITSQFFRTVEATVGLMALNFRDRFRMCCATTDAGNYAAAVPYTERDYATPMLIQASRGTARRAYFDDEGGSGTTLPAHALGNRYATSVDWRSFQKRGGLVLGPNGECRQVLQLPYYHANDLDGLPKSFSMVQLFNAGPEGEPAIAVVAPRDVMEKLEKSGVTRELIAESEGSSSDAFLEAVQETAAGIRQSVYAPLLDDKVLSTILDVDGE